MSLVSRAIDWAAPQRPREFDDSMLKTIEIGQFSALLRRVTLQRVVFVGSAIAVFSYAYTYLTAVGYYQTLGVEPDEVGANYATLVPRAIAGIFAPLSIGFIVAFALVVFPHSRVRSANRQARDDHKPHLSEPEIAVFDCMIFVVIVILSLLSLTVGLQSLGYLVSHLPLRKTRTTTSVVAWSLLSFALVVPYLMVVALAPRIAQRLATSNAKTG